MIAAAMNQYSVALTHWNLSSSIAALCRLDYMRHDGWQPFRWG